MAVWAFVQSVVTLPAIAIAAAPAPTAITARAMPYSARSWPFSSRTSLLIRFIIVSLLLPYWGLTPVWFLPLRSASATVFRSGRRGTLFMCVTGQGHPVESAATSVKFNRESQGLHSRLEGGFRRLEGVGRPCSEGGNAW